MNRIGLGAIGHEGLFLKECVSEGTVVGSTEDSSTLPVDDRPEASGQCGRSAEAGVGRLTVWSDVRGVAIRTAPVELFVLTIEGALLISLLGNWPGSLRQHGRSVETGVGKLTVWGDIRRAAIRTMPVE